MTGKQLKNSILQWAIQGKLVPQDPKDEPASVLLEKIRAEKARLVKEGKIKRDKKESIIYRGEDNSYYEKFADGKVVCIDDEIPFEVPNGWEWCRLREVIFPPKYGTSNKSVENGEMPVLRMGNIQDGEIVYEKLVYSNNADDNSKYCLINGDLLFNRTNSAELVGKTGIYRGQLPAIYAGYIILLRPILINPDYLNYILGSSYARSYCKEVKTIGVQQCNINADKISNFLIPIAPLSEQIRIVLKMGKVVEPLAKYKKEQLRRDSLNVDIRNKFKKSILQEAIQGRLVPQDASEESASVLLQRIKKEKQHLVKEGKLKKKDVVDSTIFRGDDNKYFEKKGKDTVCIDEEIPFEIPNTWVWVRLSDVVQVNPKNDAPDNTLAAFIPMERIDATYLTSFTYSERKWGDIKAGFTHFADGDVAFAKITPCFQNRKSMILKGLPNGIGAGTTELKVLRPYADTIDREYLLFFLESSYFVEEATFKGTANQQRIISGYMENKLFPLPPLSEQHRISEKIKESYKRIGLVASIMSR